MICHHCKQKLYWQKGWGWVHITEPEDKHLPLPVEDPDGVLGQPKLKPYIDPAYRGIIG